MLPPPSSSSKRRVAVDPRATKSRGYAATTMSDLTTPSSSSNNNKNRLLSNAPYSATSSPARTNATARITAPARRVELDYDIRDLLGTGTVGQVRRAIDRKTGVERAVKIIHLNRKPNNLDHSNSSNSTAIFQAEAALLQGLDHPYIVKLIDYYISPSAVYLVFELCVGGDLFDRIVQKTKYPEVQARRVMRRLLAAVYHLHEEKQIAHRDLKPENSE
jgi:hypothetical protein